MPPVLLRASLGDPPAAAAAARLFRAARVLLLEGDEANSMSVYHKSFQLLGTRVNIRETGRKAILKCVTESAAAVPEIGVAVAEVGVRGGGSGDGGGLGGRLGLLQLPPILKR